MAPNRGQAFLIIEQDIVSALSMCPRLDSDEATKSKGVITVEDDDIAVALSEIQFKSLSDVVQHEQTEFSPRWKAETGTMKLNASRWNSLRSPP